MARTFLAWVESLNVLFDWHVHAVLDEQFELIRLSQRENAAATGEITFPNPGVGLLSSSRRRFVLISESETGDPADAVLVARARILGMPTDFNASTITTQIICAPDDLDEQLASYAETIFALPYCDPLYGDERRDPTAAIAARGCSWHIDPRTHFITITDVLGGGPLVDVGFDHAGDFAIRVTEPPLRAVTQTLEVDWEQSASGITDIKSRIANIERMQNPALEVEPTTGNGWTIGENFWRDVSSRLTDVKRGYQRDRRYSCFVFKENRRYGPYSNGVGGQFYVWRHYWEKLEDYHAIEDRMDNTLLTTTSCERFYVSYQYRQARREVVTLRLEMPVQDVMGAVAEEDTGVYTLADPTIDSETPAWYPGRPGVVGDFVQHDGKRWRYASTHDLDYFYYYAYVDGRLHGITTPGFEAAGSITAMPDRRSPYFVGSGRGDQSVERALLAMRARLRYRLRCLEAVVRPGDWSVVRDITMEHSLRADHPRFGSVTGKVIGWDRAWVGGETPYRSGTVTIGACLGTGATGVGDVEDIEYSVSAEAVAVPVNAYALGSAAYAVTGVDVANDADAQVALATAEIAAGRDPTNALASAIPTVSVELRSLASIDTIERRISVTALLLDSPMGYDAGAD